MVRATDGTTFSVLQLGVCYQHIASTTKQVYEVRRTNDRKRIRHAVVGRYDPIENTSYTTAQRTLLNGLGWNRHVAQSLLSGWHFVSCPFRIVQRATMWNQNVNTLMR